MKEDSHDEEKQQWPYDPATFYDYRREREFYKYYEPFRALRDGPGPSIINIFDDEAVKAHRPRNRLDSTLTAFCQLGALRLRTRRCMLFFFDTEYAYILAEATQTLSLQDDGVHDEEDALWLGTVIIRRGLSVCEHTVNLPLKNENSESNEASVKDIHIIPNLTDDIRFCDRPFVTDGPKCRFYAGIPIITPGGYSIGAFCALDDKPRAGLSENELDFMRQMSRNVIDHLETVRLSAENGRGSRMLTSLGTFFKTAPAIGQPRPRAVESIKASTSRPRPAQRSASASTVASKADTSGVAEESLRKQAIDVKDYAEQVDSDAVSLAAPSVTSSMTAIARSSADTEDDLQTALEDSIQGTFETAAELIRTAANADGVVFLDVKNQSMEARIRRRHRKRTSARRSRHGSDTDGASTDASFATESDEAQKAQHVHRCTVLGQATSSIGHAKQALAPAFPLRVIRLLLRRYGRGKIWNFNSDGVASFQDITSDATEISDASVEATEIEAGTKETARQQRRMQETEHIQRLFPGVRALCFVPLWDTAKDRVYAVALLTTYSPLRILSTDGELGFMRAFCDVVMASIGKLESSIEEQAKTQFISSISHELRSPLHGILGGIDFLHGKEKPDKTIITQIEKCATTLIEIIEHLLEYAKINNLSKKQTLLPGLDTDPVETGGIPLARLTEDVADATFYSHICAAQSRASSVSYIFQCELGEQWRSAISVGAWKRLCMNIINNSLKYTQKGYIRVSLDHCMMEGDMDAAQLTVEDTGIGMSRDFLEDGLFKAFKQEDSLNPGTGLGMSLVAKLVKSLRGDIEVRSKKNAGTTVKIKVPLLKVNKYEAPEEKPLLDVTVAVIDLLTSKLSGLEARARRIQLNAVQQHCLTLGATIDNDRPQCRFLLSSDLPQLQSEEGRSALTGKSVILLCTDAHCAATLADNAFLSKHFESTACVTQPYGAQKLLQVIQGSLSPEQLPVSNADGVIEQVPSPLRPAAESPSLESSILPMRPKVLFKRSSETTKVLSSQAASSTDPATVGRDADQEVKDQQLPKKMPLLLVDDNEINLRILKMYAKQNGHPHMTAGDGREAVEAYKTGFAEGGTTKKYAQVIFMDINMPVMSGFEATRHIRTFERNEGLKPAVVIALTGLGSKEALEQAVSCGIDLFLTKPVRSKELTNVLQAVALQLESREQGQGSKTDV